MIRISFLAVAGLISLSGCTESAADTCALLGRERVEEAWGSKLTRFELDPGINNGRAVGSACLMQFEDGAFARLAVTEYSDLEYMAQMRQGDSRPPIDQLASEMLGVQVFFDERREALFADLSESRSLFLNLDQRGRPAQTSTTQRGSMTVMRFDHGKIPDARSKALTLARLLLPAE